MVAALQTLQAISELGEAEKAASAFLVGDLSYACGTMAKWDFFLGFIEPLASAVPLMVLPVSSYTGTEPF